MKKLIVLLILFFAKSSFSGELQSTDFSFLSDETPPVGSLDQQASTESSDFTCPFGSFDSDTTQTFNFPADTTDTAENVDSTKEPEKVQKETKEQTEQKLDRETPASMECRARTRCGTARTRSRHP